MNRHHRRPRVLALVAAVALAVTACGGAPADTTPGLEDAPDTATDAAGACLQGTVDCVDTPGLDDDEPVEIDETGLRQFAADAQYYLGRDESELPETMRVGRRGDETMMLTEDYVIGRMTAELDDLDGDGTYTVTSVTVELPDGPETFPS